MKTKITNILFLMAATSFFAACSDSDIAGISLEEKEETRSVTGTMVGIADFKAGEGDTDPVAKSQLYYDRVNNKLKFTWRTEDKIGIFPNNIEGDQFAFVLDSETPLIEQDSYVTGKFDPYDPSAAYPIEKTQKYFSYFPYKAGDLHYDAVPVSFGEPVQTQTANEQMWYYYNRTVGDNAAKFLETEKAAAAHTSAYDFMVSEATSTEGAHVHFDYKHLGAMVRFYMYCPGTPSNTYGTPGFDLYIDSLQVVNDSKPFTVDATVNIEDKTLTPTRTSRVMTLRFNPAIDMTNYDTNPENPILDKTKEDGSYYYWRKAAGTGNIYGYIMAYMMIAPIDLTGEEVKKSTLYLVTRKASYYTFGEYNAAKGTSIDEATFNALPKIQKMKIYENLTEYNEAHDPDISQDDFDKLPASDKMKDYERKIYAKNDMSKINFEAGKHYQWNVTDAGDDEPITFHEITIQEWKAATGWTNGGAGTEDW